MRIVVLIKQVPDTTEIEMDPETGRLKREAAGTMINPFDEYAVEEAVRVKERLGGTVTAISMGPPQAEAALKDAISVGVDEGILLSDMAFAGSDTLATSYTLACTLKKTGFDIIFCGKQAIDGDTAQVGPGVAGHLDIPQACYVRKIEEIDEKHARVECLMEDGYEVLDVPLPALLTVVKEINEPRLPSLRGKMRARKAKVTVLTADDIPAEKELLGTSGSPTQVDKIFYPEKRKGGEKWTGERDELARKLFDKLKEMAVV